ncbi:MAG: hypothetical protein FJW53_06415 [Actinobacteria bacterium]|nr:hypothetical protein [Actinomycetota bacterium]
MQIVAYINGTVVPLGVVGRLVSAEEGGTGAETGQEPKGPSPIAPEGKELLWGAGSFLVFFALMQIVLVPRVKRGMQARYEGVRSVHDQAVKTTDDARADLEAYQRALAAARAEGAGRVEAARRTVDSERTERLAEVNARIAEMRAVADREAAAARASANESIAEAVGRVATRAAELATGRAPSADNVRAAVDAALRAR